MDIFTYLSLVVAFCLGMFVSWPIAKHHGFIKGHAEASAQKQAEDIINQIMGGKDE